MSGRAERAASFAQFVGEQVAASTQFVCFASTGLQVARQTLGVAPTRKRSSRSAAGRASATGTGAVAYQLDAPAVLTGCIVDANGASYLRT